MYPLQKTVLDAVALLQEGIRETAPAYFVQGFDPTDDSRDEVRFRRLLTTCPEIHGLYNEEHGDFNLLAVRDRFKTGSQRVKTLMAFLKLVWDPSHSWGPGIDNYPILKNIESLQAEEVELILDWARQRYFPYALRKQEDKQLKL